MTELERYLAEEVAEDHVDGIITRREAMRRLGLLGLSTAAASAMIAAEAQARTTGKGGGHHHGNDGKETTWAPPPAQAIEFAGPRGKLMASWAPATKPRGGVLVIHENRGLTAHITHVARPLGGERLVGAGARPAVRGGRDRVVPGRGRRSRGGSRRSRRDPKSTRFVDDMKAAVDASSASASGAGLRWARRASASAAGWSGTCWRRASRGSRPPRRSTARSRPAAT